MKSLPLVQRVFHSVRPERRRNGLGLLPPATLLIALLLPVTAGRAAGAEPPQHPAVGQRYVPTDVDRANPAYRTTFDDAAALSDWRLEGGRKMGVENGRLVLESVPGELDNHLVCWLTREMPGDFLLEFTLRPRDRKDGLNIVFFNYRGAKGESIFDPSLGPRRGVFKEYHSSDLNGYHVSYWAGARGTANLRKNAGFKLVATGPDFVVDAPAAAEQLVQVYKRGGMIRVMIDGIVSVAWDDDGRSNGPVWNHRGWIGLRQMGRTTRCEYDAFAVYPLKP